MNVVAGSCLSLGTRLYEIQLTVGSKVEEELKERECNNETSVMVFELVEVSSDKSEKESFHYESHELNWFSS
jgi:hypothetical protein